MSLPQSGDYKEAVQRPDLCFADPDLQHTEPGRDVRGLPLIWSGNFAVVFKLVSNHQTWAVKCFTRTVANLQNRYAEIDKYLKAHSLPYFVPFEYQPRGIRIRGDWFPIVKMQWIEGQSLKEFLNERLNEPPDIRNETLQNLMYLCWHLAKHLEQCQIAHGDLQHGNMLFCREGNVTKLKLVDYDGMYVPSLHALLPEELGHPNYQHPQRGPGTYGLTMDRFAHLVIFTTLWCLKDLPQPRLLWDRYTDDERLLFSRHDFVAPAHSSLFQQLWKECSSKGQCLVGHLLLAAQAPPEQTPLLTTLVSPEKNKDFSVSSLTDTQRSRIQTILG